MDKKNFKQTNPALAFINTEEPAEEIEEVTAPASEDAEKIPEGFKVNPEFIEKKSQRVQLLLQPSVVSAVKKLANDRNQSLNETVNEAIKYYLEKEGN